MAETMTRFTSHGTIRLRPSILYHSMDNERYLSSANP